MRINKIHITNLGSYEGENSIIVSNNPKKNIILVGGKNGAGKTTLFDSIKICLYGYKAYGYQLFSVAYKKHIYSMINDSAKLSHNMHASVSLELEIDDNQNINKYIISRIWSNKNSRFEEFRVLKNGILLDEDLTEDFSNYLIGLIPPELFNLYFFDGEQIAEYFLSDGSGCKLKNAFLTLCGYDTFNIMLENFNRIVKNKKTDSKISAYVNARDSFQLIKTEYDSLKEQEKNLIQKIDDIDNESKMNEKVYRKKGGVTEDEWNLKIQELKEEEQNREYLNSEIKKLANDVIPLLILKEQINNLDSIIANENLHMDENTLDKIQSVLPLLIQNMPLNMGISFNKEDSKQISKYIISKLKEIDRKNLGERKLYISISEQSILLQQIKFAQSLDKRVVIDNRQQLKCSIANSKKLRRELNNCSIDYIKSYQEKKNKCDTDKKKLLKKLEDVKELIKAKETTKLISEQNYNKATKDLDNELKNNSVIDVSAKSIVCIEDLLKSLVKSKKEQVEKAFIIKLNQLKQKDIFVSRVEFDDNFFIHAYKTILRDNGEREEVEIDKTRLSKGEKQVFIMALYWALMTISRIQIPFMIDTPFARIDSMHREKITSYFFRELSGQVFIFSTDEEICGKHLDLLKDKISDKMLLVNKNNKNTIILKDCYFGDKYGI